MTRHPKTPRTTHRWPRGLAVAALAAALLASPAPAVAEAPDEALSELVAATVASENDSIERFRSSGDETVLYATGAYDTPANLPALLSNDYRPQKFDLREKGLVTPVKLQNPWGACWSFGAIAASETAIQGELSHAGLWTPGSSEPLDLSELHLAWFAYQPAGSRAGSQAAEGTYPTASGDAGILNAGGQVFLGSSIFSKGEGPLNESEAPYRNHNGAIEYYGSQPFCYAASGGWSVPESLHYRQDYVLSESRVLPNPTQDGTYVASATDAIKDELMADRAVGIAFHADQSVPGETGVNHYIDTTHWAQYTYDNAQVNHAVTIVGWDDTIPASWFAAGGQSNLPPGDGAWIVKNSWGALDQPFPNDNPQGWGIDGNGYFYLSYYDKSIYRPETFDFYTEADEDPQVNDHVAEYDFVPSAGNVALSAQVPVSMANVFTTGTDENGWLLKSISFETTTAGTSAAWSIHLLDADDDPTGGTVVASATEQYAYGGYHRITLADPLKLQPGQRYSLVVALEAPTGPQLIVNRAVTEQGAQTFMAEGYSLSNYSRCIVEKGESYLCTPTSSWDWRDYLDEVMTQGGSSFYGYDNFALKSYLEADPDAEPPVAMVNAYRLYNPNNGDHFFTFSAAERDGLIDGGWSYEGIAWSAPATSPVPVYRVYNPNTGEHFYTIHWNEVEDLVAHGWGYEGSQLRAEPSGTPMYRVYNPSPGGFHMFTKSARERDGLVAIGWRNEGIAWYV